MRQRWGLGLSQARGRLVGRVRSIPPLREGQPIATPPEVIRDRPARDTGERRPSYMYKLNESKRRKLLLDTVGHRQRIWAHNGKRDGRAFACSAGVSIPAVVVDSVRFGDVDWSVLPDCFVIKPDNGAANRGVFLLDRLGTDTFVDCMDGRCKTVADIESELRGLVEARLVSAAVSIEELLRPRSSLADQVRVPDDFKVYCFYDRAAVVMQRRMLGSADAADWRFKFWSADWKDLGAVKYPDRVDPSLELPEGAVDLIETAEHLGRHLAVPFARWDLYDTHRGIVFGEVTPHPGPPEVWSPELDEQLGHAWELAEVRLLAEGIAPNEPQPRPPRTP